MSYIGNSPGVASQRVTTTLTATAGQTQFTTQSGYVLGYVDVYLNGAKLVNGSDFEAITGTYITLFSGATVGDVIELISYVPRGLSDGYTKAEADAKFLDVGGDTATGTINLGANGLVVGTNQLVASGGFVGIGTASPTVKLHLEGAANSAPVTLLRLNNAGSASGGPGIASRISFTVGASSLGFIQGSNYATGATGLQFSGDGTNAQLLLDSTGNVGIGTISPTTKLQVSHVGDLASAAVVIGDQATPASITGIYLRSTTKSNINFSSGGVLAFNGAGDGSAERMRIDANGNVGINITTPGAKLDVQSGTNPAVVIRNSYTFAGANYHLRIIGDGTSSGYITQLPAQGGLSLAEGMRYYGAGPWVPDSGVTAASSINMLSGAIAFTTTQFTVNTNFTPQERMRIDSTGLVGIGTSAPSHALTVQGSLGATTSLNALTLLTLRNSLDGGVGINFTNSVSIPLASINALVTSSGAGTDDGILSFSTATNAVNAERMRIDSTGNTMIGTTSAYNSAKLSVNGKISAGDNSATSGSVLLESQYGAGTLGLFGTEYSSGGAVMAYGMRPANTAAAAFKNAYSGGGNLTYSAITVADGIRFYTNTGQTLALNADVTISERMRLTTTGSLVLGHNAGWSYTTDVGSVVLSNGGSDTPNVMFLTGINKNWGIDSWNPTSSGPQSTQYLRFVKDINETGGSMAVTISPIGSIGLGSVTPASGVGIAFPAAQVASSDANTLDDYEEGTFAPTISTESGTNYTLGSATYTYTKIGNTVTIVAEIPYTAQGSGTITMISLPFIPSNTRYVFTGTVTGTSNANNRTAIQLIHYSSNMCLVKMAGVDQNYWASKTNFPTSGSFYITGTYHTT